MDIINTNNIFGFGPVRLHYYFMRMLDVSYLYDESSCSTKVFWSMLMPSRFRSNQVKFGHHLKWLKMTSKSCKKKIVDREAWIWRYCSWICPDIRGYGDVTSGFNKAIAPKFKSKERVLTFWILHAYFIVNQAFWCMKICFYITHVFFSSFWLRLLGCSSPISEGEISLNNAYHQKWFLI